jgi:hypothetical protein
VRLTRVTIKPDGPAAPAIDTALLVDAIWAGVVASDSVEHIVARREPDRIEIGVFTLPVGDVAARDVVERALLRSPLLRQWAISDPKH